MPPDSRKPESSHMSFENLFSPWSADFHYNLESFITAPSQTGKPITLDSQPSNLLTSRGVGDVELDPADLYRYKTTRRDAYDEAAKRGSEYLLDTH